MKSYIKKSLILVSILTLAVMLISFPSTSGATTPIGTYCFQMTDWDDLWVWDIEQVAPDVFQVTGHDVENGPTAMDGGGRVLNNMLLLTVQESSPTFNSHGTHAIEIDLSTLCGTTDLVWFDETGTPVASYVDLAFCSIPCPDPYGPAPVAVNRGLSSTSGN